MKTSPPSGLQAPGQNQSPEDPSHYSQPQRGFTPHIGQHPAPGPHQWPPRQPGRSARVNSLKWLLIAIVVLLVIGVTIGATLLYAQGGGNDANPAGPTNGSSDFASATDSAPVAVVLDEPTCKAFTAINNGLADITERGWGASRDTLGPQSDWTAAQREQVDEVTSALKNAADQVGQLAKQTPHRVIRELYEQFIAYARAYADSVPSYTPRDNNLASANVSAGSALIGICNSIAYESTRRSLSLEGQEPPIRLAPPDGTPSPGNILEPSDPVCAEWIARLDAFTSATPDWQERDGSIPGSQWTPERRALEKATTPLLNDYVDEIVRAGRASDSPVLEDFAVAASLYIQAYIAAGEDYTQADSWLIYTGFSFANLMSAACRSEAG